MVVFLRLLCREKVKQEVFSSIIKEGRDYLIFIRGFESFRKQTRNSTKILYKSGSNLEQMLVPQPWSLVSGVVPRWQEMLSLAPALTRHTNCSLCCLLTARCSAV